MGFKSGIREGLWWTPIVALLAVLPFFWFGTSNGHDLTFHVNSWIEVARQWKSGVFYPHWATFANYGNGEPRFVFYPPISWTAGALLGSFLPWSAVPGTLSALVCIAAGLSMYLFAREWTDDHTAVLAAVLYAVNPYQLVVIYERAAFAEMIASIWLPGMLLFALRERGGLAKNSLLLGLHVAALWLTNLPAAVIASYLLAFVVIVRAVHVRKTEPLLRAAIAMALGLGLAAFFLVPAIYEQRWVQIGQAVSSGASPRENFLFAHTADREHDAVLLRTSIFAVIEFACAALFGGLARPLQQRAPAIYKTLLGMLALSVLLMTPLSLVLWNYAPKLMYVQFPWRWLLVVNLAMIFFAAVTFARTRAAQWALVVLIPLVIALCYWRFRQPIYPEDRPVALAEAIQAGEGYEGTDEYTPIQADNSNLSPDMPRIAIQVVSENDDQRKVTPNTLAHSESEEWTPEHKRFRIDSQVATRDTIRLLDYPAWRVRVDGEDYPRSANQSDGRMEFELPAGSHEITVDYARTRDVIWGRIVSLIACIAAGVLWIIGHHKREERA